MDKPIGSQNSSWKYYSARISCTFYSNREFFEGQIEVQQLKKSQLNMMIQIKNWIKNRVSI